MEFQVGGNTYRANKLPVLGADSQTHIVRRLAPFIGAIVPVIWSIKNNPTLDANIGVLKPLGDALAAMSDADADYVQFALLRASKRQIPGGKGWAEVVVGSQLNHLDINLVHVGQIMAQVFRYNLADFMDALPSDLLARIQTPSAA